MNTLVVIDVNELETMIHRVVEEVVRNHVEPEEKLLTPEQLGERIEVSAALVRHWAREEGCPHIRAGKKYLFRHEDVVRWLEEHA